ncbi:LAMI_0G05952g1_1 [Lachancea mirantina]|uniref:LAMI_0G05952g1_1 n=1 Tax=Lachancea mirantina TaxID=1230905 RepID=A0A1G4K906_9SACH|nr:LAMI_0G05952g1_1 [Lachancea mirantina]
MSEQQATEKLEGVERPMQQPQPQQQQQQQQQDRSQHQHQRYPRGNDQRQGYQKTQRSNSKQYNGNYQNNRYNKNGYQNKGNRNGGANAMQWAYGSYGIPGQPQFYPSYGFGYMPQVAQGYQPPQAPVSPVISSATSNTMSPSSSNPSLSSTPVAKKIEITNRSGEHVDLNAIHSQHLASTGGASVKEVPKEAAKSPVAEVAVPAAVPAPVTEEPKASNSVPSQEEILKMSFLEQVRKRKELLAKQKAGIESPAATAEPIEKPSASAAPVVAKAEPEVPSEAAAQAPAADGEEGQKSFPSPTTETPKDNEDTTPKEPVEVPVKTEEKKIDDESHNVEVAVKPPILPEEEEKDDSDSSKPLTFAEKLKLKKQAEAKVATESKQETASSTAVSGEEPAARQELDQEEPAVGKVEETDQVASEQTPEGPVESVDETATTETDLADEAKKSDEETEDQDIDDGKLTMTELLKKLQEIPVVEDVYSHKYPEGVEAPDPRYRREKIKYTYGPTFLLQFQNKVNVRADAEWKTEIASKIVIPPETGRVGGKGKDSKFGPGSGFKKSGSLRGMEGRSNSRSSSKRKSKRMGDDRKSGRAYTSRKDRERMAEEEAEKAKEDVAPLVASANRWVPKSRQKKTEKKFAPDGVTELLEKDEAERKMKSLLNKLTLEKFDTISEEIIQIADQSKWEKEGETLRVVIEEIFNKATDEPHWSSMYAQLCGKVVKDMDPEIIDENNEGKAGPKLVLHYLVDRCHTEFQKGWTDKLPTKEDGSPLEPEMMSDEYYVMAAAKRRGLGLVRFIGFLYRSNLLTAKMMFECFRRLMKDLADSPSEETLESVIELLGTVGEQFEGDKLVQPNGALEGSTVLDQLFFMLDKITQSGDLSSRIKFKLVDMKELREKKHWNNAKRDEGPKTIQQIHEEEAAKKAHEERERRLKSGSRSNSRRNNSNMGPRNGSRRDLPSMSKDNFISTRSTSLRHAQSSNKEEAPAPKTATNMFDALMGPESDED